MGKRVVSDSVALGGRRPRLTWKMSLVHGARTLVRLRSWEKRGAQPALPQRESAEDGRPPREGTVRAARRAGAIFFVGEGPWILREGHLGTWAAVNTLA